MEALLGFVHKLLFLLCLFALPTCATYVAVLETVSEKDVIGRSEKMFLTDKLRERAKAVLPTYMGYVVMTRENINAMLPPGKSIEECEGSCLVETGKNIAADYVAQARIGKFGKQLTLTMELYETAGNNLVGTFTARKPDAEGLLEEIDRDADRVFQQILEAKVAVGGSEGISDVSTSGGGYQAIGTRRYIVHVKSSPVGAIFSVDGRVNAGCNRTPCDMTLTAGSHMFSFSMEMYQDRDVMVDVQKNEQKILAELTPNFGELIIAPLFQENMGSLDEIGVFVDGKKLFGKTLQLSVGNHNVQITHRCYETVTFNVSVTNGSQIIFDKKMQPLMGGLQMDAEQEGKPNVMPVYVNGKKMGETPFLETVPICARVEIGEDKENVPVKLKAAEIVKFKYKGIKELVDSRDGKKYRMVEIGNQTWMAENLNYKIKGSCCYGNKDSNCAKYGRLYTWKVANVVCPRGWHLPSKSEFETLIESVGGKSVAGKMLKSTKGWRGGGNGSDTYVFSAFPTGFRNYDTSFSYDGNYGAYFWSSTEFNSNYVYYMYLNYSGDSANLDYYYKLYGFSVRCLKD